MDFIISNFIPIAVVVVIAFILIRRSQQKKDNVIRQDVQQKTEAEAKALGIQVNQQADGSVRGGEVMGTNDFQGNTGGIDWTLRSSLSTGQKGRKIGKSMWRTSAVKWPTGKFLLLISTPADMKSGKIERGGFMNTLINKAADMLLDVYVGVYFGSEYKDLVNIGEDGVKIERETLRDFTILTNHPELAERFLDEPTATVISGWKQSSQGFSKEQQVDQFGLLFAPDGVILTCQANMTSPAEVKLLSDFGAVLATKMKGLVDQKEAVS
ncbi:MAG: hypothetical protein JNL40_07235 [Cyclobacteriaceae bacterium]|nr:hypothetical protein [Cyclobacteriaceae bacterium]